MPKSLKDATDRVAQAMPDVVAELGELVGHASVSAPGFPREPVVAAAQTTARCLARHGIPGVHLLDVPDGYPVVFADLPAPPGAPTVLLYSHYDVVPATHEDGWTDDPWTLAERDGRLYARGVADDKSGVLMHAAALGVFGGRPPVGVKVVIEGEEESVSHLHDYVRDHPEQFVADTIVVADLGNLTVGRPALTTSLRGDITVVVKVRALRHALHSGEFGGPVPDALAALVRILASLLDDHGDIVVDGLYQSSWPPTSLTEDDLRGWADLEAGAQLLGSGTVASRLWAKPAASIIGVDAPGVDQGSNRLVPEASAKVSFRVVAGQDPGDAIRAIVAHVRAATPWGAEVEVRVDKAYAGFAVPSGGRALAAARSALEDAFEEPCAEIGSGASIPLLSVLRSAVPHAEFILWGAADLAGASTHGVDESVDRRDLERMIVAEALLLQRLGDQAQLETG